jgi:hypothetical protein
MKKLLIHPVNLLLVSAFVLLIFSDQIRAQDSEIKNPGQFLYPEFLKGIVAQKTGKDIALMLNYNIVTEKMVFLQKGEIYDMVNYEWVDTVYLAGQKFIPVAKVFYEVGVEAPVSMFIQHKGKVQLPPKPAAYGGTSEVSSSTYINNMQLGNLVYMLKNESNLIIKPENVYWIRYKDKLSVFLNEKQLAAILPDYKTQIRQFVKDNKLKFDRTEDVTNLFVYLNTLIR